MMSYLVTGAMGCIGAWTLYHLVKQGQSAVSFDQSENKSRLNLLLSPEEQEKISFVSGDLRDYAHVEAVMRENNVSHIVHLAALQVPTVRENPVLGAQVNVVGMANILQAARTLGIPQIAYASSIAVYGSAEDYHVNLLPHDAPAMPRTLYGVYKVADEQMARVYYQDYGLRSVGLRPYVVYGAGRDQGLTSDPTKAILAAVKGESFKINFTGVMQFQWASDVAQQFLAAATNPYQGAGAYNLGGRPTTVEGFISALQQLIPQSQISHSETILPFPQAFDDSALRSVFTVYETPLADGIERTISQFEQALADGRLT
jgi:nucleoside-diphosphate-sugar epimerase